MNIRGIHKTSFIDFPGRISVVLFTGGCNLQCCYCHNPELAHNSDNLERHDSEHVLAYLQKRKGLIDGVTISGGEPTLRGGLEPFITRVKDIGFSVKLDTNGLQPEVVENLVGKKLLDYVALDIKTSPGKYRELTGVDVDFSKIISTASILKNSPIEYELRTTCVPGFVTLDDFAEIKKIIGPVQHYYLQQMISTTPLIDERLRNSTPYPLFMLESFREFVSTFAAKCVIRGI